MRGRLTSPGTPRRWVQERLSGPHRLRGSPAYVLKYAVPIREARPGIPDRECPGSQQCH